MWDFSFNKSIPFTCYYYNILIKTKPIIDELKP